jgi:hypothetical protein
MPDPKQVRGSVKPHGHTNKMCGPYVFMLGKQSQTANTLQSSRQRFFGVSKGRALLCIEQPNEGDNFSLIRLLFVPDTRNSRASKFHSVSFHRKKDGTISVYIKKRYTDTLLHPIPVGPYKGTCVTGEGFANYTFQALTLNKTAEPSQPKTIITPGDVDYDLTLDAARRKLS